MAVEMVKFILSGVSTTSNMLSVAIFKGTALLIVTIFRVIQLPGWAINCLLCLFRQSITAGIDTAVDTSGKLLASAVNIGSEFIANATTTAVSSITEVAMVEKELLVNATTEVYEFALQTGSEIASTFMENLWEAFYILMNNTAKK